MAARTATGRALDAADGVVDGKFFGAQTRVFLAEEGGADPDLDKPPPPQGVALKGPGTDL